MDQGISPANPSKALEQGDQEVNETAAVTRGPSWTYELVIEETNGLEVPQWE